MHIGQVIWLLSCQCIVSPGCNSQENGCPFHVWRISLGCNSQDKAMSWEWRLTARQSRQSRHGQSQTRSSSGGDAIHDSGSGASGGVASPGSSACSVPTNLSNLRLRMPVLSSISIWTTVNAHLWCLCHFMSLWFSMSSRPNDYHRAAWLGAACLGLFGSFCLFGCSFLEVALLVTEPYSRNPRNEIACHFAAKTEKKLWQFLEWLQFFLAILKVAWSVRRITGHLHCITGIMPGSKQL